MADNFSFIIVRAGTNCKFESLTAIPTDLDDDLNALGICLNPSSFSMNDIKTGLQIKHEISSLLTKYSSYFRLRSIQQDVDELADNENIILVDAKTYTNLDIYMLILALQAQKQGLNPIQAYVNERSKFLHSKGDRYTPYLVLNLGYRQFVGEPDKSRRRCRFCGRTTAEAGKNIFGDPRNSHAISYFLGNDYIFCLEECKECNERFGGTIEVDLANYYSVYRALEKRTNRDGDALTADGFNYTIDDKGVSIYTFNDTDGMPVKGEPFPESGVNLMLDREGPVCLHNIYKVMVKYAIASLPNSFDITVFQDTIKWIRGEKKPNKHSLPSVYRIETLDNVNEPYMSIWIRNDEKKTVPYSIVEFRFMENLYVFTIPYVRSKDLMHPMLKVQMEEYMSRNYQKEFTVENFCDDSPRLITTHVRMTVDDSSITTAPADSVAESQQIMQEKKNKMMRKFGTTDLHK